MERNDLRWLWAAYRIDRCAGDLPEGIERDNFETEILARVQQSVGVWTMQAPVPSRGVIPVGIVTAWSSVRLPHHIREIHCTWFPWATPRNKIESAVNFIHRMRMSFELFWPSKMSTVKFFEHVCKYGIARRMCAWRNYFGKGDDAMMFQSRDVT